MSLTIADVRARVETDLDNETLQKILDAAVEDLERRCGRAASETEVYRASGRRSFSLLRRAVSISSVTERRCLGSEPVTLSADDYRRVGYELIRIATGTNPAITWGHEVIVEYAPEVDSSLRDRVVLDVCQMDAEFRALANEKTGDWQGDYSDHEARRDSLFRQVQEGRSLVV